MEQPNEATRPNKALGSVILLFMLLVDQVIGAVLVSIYWNNFFALLLHGTSMNWYSAVAMYDFITIMKYRQSRGNGTNPFDIVFRMLVMKLLFIAVAIILTLLRQTGGVQ